MKYEIGDTVKLNEKGKKIRVDRMAWWRGRVIDTAWNWITVQWLDEVIYTEKPEWLEKV